MHFGDGTAEKLLVEFGEFTARGDAAVAKDRADIVEGIEDAVRGFKEDEGCRQAADRFKGSAAGAGLGREETAKVESIGGEAGTGEGGQEGRRSGDGDDGYAAFGGEADEAETGIGDKGSATIRHQGHAYTSFQFSHDRFGFGGFVMLVKAASGLVYPIEFQELSGLASVFASDPIDRFESFGGAAREVAEISYRSGNQIQGPRHYWISIASLRCFSEPTDRV